jgi:PleD family two-component response regulator
LLSFERKITKRTPEMTSHCLLTFRSRVEISMRKTRTPVMSVSLIHYDGEDINEFLERADAVLYRAKWNKKRKAYENSKWGEA